MNYTVYVHNSTDGQLGGWTDIFQTIGTIGAGITPAIIPLTGLPQSVQQAISAGSQVLAGFLSSLGNSGQAKGLAAINAFGQQVIAQFSQLAQAAQSGMPKAQVYQIADQLVAVLGNSQYVYQAKNGRDAEALRNFKTQAAQLAQQVKQIADAVNPGTPTTPGTIPTNPTTPGTTPTTPTTPGISIFPSFGFEGSNLTTYLILGGGILLVVWWLKS